MINPKKEPRGFINLDEDCHDEDYYEEDDEYVFSSKEVDRTTAVGSAVYYCVSGGSWK